MRSASNHFWDPTYDPVPNAGFTGGDSLNFATLTPDGSGGYDTQDYTLPVNVLNYTIGWGGLSQATSAAPYVAVIPQLSPSLDWSTLIGSVQGMLPLDLGVDNAGFNNQVTMSISGGDAHIEVYDDGSDGFDAAEVAGYGTSSMTFGTNDTSAGFFIVAEPGSSMSPTTVTFTSVLEDGYGDVLSPFGQKVLEATFYPVSLAYDTSSPVSSPGATATSEPALGGDGGVPASNEQFLPLTVSLSSGVDLSTASLIFSYGGSEAGADTIGDMDPSSSIRLWTQDNGSSLNSESILSGGDYVPAGVAIPASLLFADGGTSETLYVEAVSATDDPGAMPRIEVSLSPGDGINLPMTSTAAVTYDVNEARIVSVTATGQEDPTNETVTVKALGPEPSSADLYVEENSSGVATIQLSPTISPASGADTSRLMWQVSGDSANPSSGTFTLGSGGQLLATTLLQAVAKGVAVSSVNHDFEISVGYANASGELGTVACIIDVHVLAASVETINQNQDTGVSLARNQENTPGVYVPIDNLDEDYNGTPDYLQAGPVSGGDNLLVPIYLPAVGGSDPGFYTFNIPGDIKLWAKDDKSGAFVASTSISAGIGTYIYAEGFSIGSGVLDISWHNNSSHLNNINQIKFTTFNWNGPQDVPNYAIYQYTASGAGAGSGWVDVNGGSIHSGANTNNAHIFWNSQNAEVGSAIYQADAAYSWGFEVNVVAIDVTLSSVTPPLGKAMPVAVNPAFKLVVISPPGDITFHATVSIQGAGLSGTRGLKFMEVGYVQNETWIAKRAIFPGGGVRSSSVEGHIYVDPAPGSILPWSDSGAGSGAFISNPSNGIIQLDHLDGPRDGIPTTTLIFGTLLTSGQIVADFTRFVAVQTTDSANDADETYTDRAQAAWSIDYSGLVVGGIYVPSAPLAIIGPTGGTFQTVNSGEKIYVVGKPTANDAVSQQIWSGGLFPLFPQP